MIWMIIGTIAAALVGLGLFVYFLMRGQFEDDENVKYQLFREENPED